MEKFVYSNLDLKPRELEKITVEEVELLTKAFITKRKNRIIEQAYFTRMLLSPSLKKNSKLTVNQLASPLLGNESTIEKIEKAKKNKEELEEMLKERGRMNG